MFAKLKFHYAAIKYKLRTNNKYIPVAIILFNSVFGLPFYVYRLIFGRRYRSEIRKILVIRAEGIGDMVLATPFFKALKKKYPHSHIACLATSISAEVIEDNPHIDSVITFDPPWYHQTKGMSGRSELLDIMRRIRKNRYDMGIDLRANYKNIFFLMFLTGIPLRVSFDTAICSFLLSLKVPFEPNRHENYNFMNILRKLGGGEYDSTPEIFLTGKDRSRARQFCVLHNLNPLDLKIVFHPGAAPNREYKKWPLQYYHDLGRALIDKYQAKIIITCSQMEYEAAASLQEQLGEHAIIAREINSLKEVTALLDCCDLCIATSTGIIHLAAAVGTPQIVLCGPEDLNRWSPLGNNHTLLMKEVPCRPCSEAKCPWDGYCLKSITPQEVFNCIDKKLYATQLSS